jgi:hypothetical protein
MRKSYLFVYNDNVGTRQAVQSVLDQMQSVVLWRYDMPNVFYLVSDNNANELSREFQSLRGTKGRFIFLEYTGNAQGRLTADSWYLLNNSHHNPQR